MTGPRLRFWRDAAAVALGVGLALFAATVVRAQRASLAGTVWLATPPDAEAALEPSSSLFVGAVAGWAQAFGSARCEAAGALDVERVARLAATASWWNTTGLTVAVGGALADHPLVAFAAAHEPQLLAKLLGDAGIAAVMVGIEDLNGPLLREPSLSRALSARGVAIVASNLICAGEAFCADWHTAEDPVLVVEHSGQRFALISLLPDDALARVEPAAGQRLALQPAAKALAKRVLEARKKQAQISVASIDYGNDPSAIWALTRFAGEAPPDQRPDVLFHSNASADQQLFQRPRGVRPAVIGSGDGEVTVARVTPLAGTGDTDVLARSAPLRGPDGRVQTLLEGLSEDYCRTNGAGLKGAQLTQPMTHAQLVTLAASAVRELEGADLAILDPAVFDPRWQPSSGTQLQRAEAERALLQDAPLVEGSVDRKWIERLLEARSAERPLVITGVDNDDGKLLIAGRPPVAEASYRVVTSSVLARSGRLQGGVQWHALEDPKATLRGALVSYLEVEDPRDPRERVRDPRLGTQWVFRADAEARGNLTSIRNPADYDEPTLQVDPSRQAILRALVNWDADSPEYLFENLLQLNFDRDYATDNTAQDLLFMRTTYTYRGLSSRILWRPHPFIENYVETQIRRPDDKTYHHLLVRPQLGLRTEFSSVLSLKLSAGVQSEVLDPDSDVFFGLGAELLLKPWAIDVGSGTLQLDGNVLYYWSAPAHHNRHLVRGQLIVALPVLGPLQLTLGVVATLRDDEGLPAGLGLGMQGGVRFRFVDRSMPN